MRGLTPVFLILLLVSLPSLLLGAEKMPSQDSLVRVALETKLYERDTWLALLHYRKSLFSDTYYSEADDPAFFLSPEGPHDPRAELLATLHALYLPQRQEDSDPRCRFPARFAWLKTQLGLQSTSPICPFCKKLRKWKAQIDLKQVTVVFPAAYLNNPSSMFGHTFLRLDPAKNRDGGYLLAPSVNFAADVSSQKGIFDYMVKGLFGGFPANNSAIPFYMRLKKYSDIESRDLWEYTLDLSPEEIERMILHLWELKDNPFAYYFLDENCAYRMMALLEVARPRMHITRHYGFYTIPIDIVRSLSKSGAIASCTYKPSATKTLFCHAKDLNPAETRLTIDIARGRLAADSPILTDLAPSRKALVLALSSEYLDLLINKDIIDRNESGKIAYDIFSERSKCPFPVTFKNIPATPVRPDKGHPTKRVTVGFGYDGDDAFSLIGFRGAYHGFFDPIAGFEKGAQLECLNLEARVYGDDRLRIEKLDLINISCLTPVSRFFTPASWSFSLGGERQKLDGEQPSVYGVKSELGLTARLSNLLASGMLHLEINGGSGLDHGFGFAAGVKLNLLYQSDPLCLGIGALWMHYLVGDTDSVQQIWGQISYALGMKNSVFLKAALTPTYGKRDDEISFGLYHYF
jgi:Domain of unknown function (DUF4105)